MAKRNEIFIDDSLKSEIQRGLITHEEAEAIARKRMESANEHDEEIDSLNKARHKAGDCKPGHKPPAKAMIRQSGNARPYSSSVARRLRGD